MASDAAFMQRIRPAGLIFVPCLVMTFTAVIHFIIINVMMAIYTIEAIAVYMFGMRKQNFPRFILEHQSYGLFGGGGIKGGITDDSCYEKDNHHK